MLKIKVLVLGRLASFEVELPATRIVCPSCNGSGTQLCDSLRGVAFSPEDMDPDFSQSYFGGDYDEQCSHCNGENVVLAVDEERVSQKMLKRYYAQMDEDNMSDAADAAERRYFERACGGQ